MPILTHLADGTTFDTVVAKLILPVVHFCISDNMTEELLESHKAEISRLKHVYERHKDLYDRLARRQKLWNEYLNLEVLEYL